MGDQEEQGLVERFRRVFKRKVGAFFLGDMDTVCAESSADPRFHDFATVVVEGEPTSAQMAAFAEAFSLVFFSERHRWAKTNLLQEQRQEITALTSSTTINYPFYTDRVNRGALLLPDVEHRRLMRGGVAAIETGHLTLAGAEHDIAIEDQNRQQRLAPRGAVDALAEKIKVLEPGIGGSIMVDALRTVSGNMASYGLPLEAVAALKLQLDDEVDPAAKPLQRYTALVRESPSRNAPIAENLERLTTIVEQDEFATQLAAFLEAEITVYETRRDVGLAR